MLMPLLFILPAESVATFVAGFVHSSPFLKQRLKTSASFDDY